MKTTQTKSSKQAADLEAIRREIDEAERKLASTEVEAELAMEEANKARRKADRARCRLAVAEAKARAIYNANKRTN